MFPPTFLYTQSWEDPRPDMQVLHYPPNSPFASATRFWLHMDTTEKA